MTTPHAIDIEQTMAFLQLYLGPKGKRILDAGCGEGHLVAELRINGYEAYGIDVDAKAIALARQQGLPVEVHDFLTFIASPYDTIIFRTSLHHIHPLDQAVAHAAELLVPNGTLVLDEFAVETMDRATAWWFFTTQDLLLATALLREEVLPSTVSDQDPLERWQAGHTGDKHPLSTARAMREAVLQHFDVMTERPAPYLYRYWLDRINPGEQGKRVAEELIRIESRGILDGILRPIGLHLVARKRIDGTR